MRTPEEIIGADAVAALEAEGYMVAKPGDLFPIPMIYATREQAVANYAKIMDGFEKCLAASYATGRTRWVDGEGREHHWERMCNTSVEIIDEPGNG